MHLSVVLSTRNRAPQLAETLERWTKVDAPFAWEIVVVDNGSTDETQAVLARFKEQFRGHLTVVVERRKGLSFARNSGWRAAQGEVIAFTDDDCYPAEDFLTRVAEPFGEDDRLGFIGGRILLYDKTDYPITIQDLNERIELPANSFIATGLIQGANLACRRAALVDVGGLDERFGAGTRFPCEDIDLVARIGICGWAGAYDPRPVVYHHHRRKTEVQAAQLMRQYDHGRGAYYVKSLLNPSMRAVYGKTWLWFVLRQSPRKTLRELIAGVDYLFSLAVRRQGPGPA